ncbi:NUDIX hydrolase [Aliifodinibius sp. S!AR15-10]|uniref:NUDIX hydrolase n=1 Tax=Aliifodinibius sp. S!AR15-10 TaxID=2950437 RepID=UPI002865EA93|nr:NUDIX hydrolase [Aliifodinibius sp. S!AR15-10]MDR8393873.1 NUDIX hydrolase [Aliifodinibius sp. S!AR15-10]
MADTFRLVSIFALLMSCLFANKLPVQENPKPRELIVNNPKSLVEEHEVPFREVTRRFAKDKFNGLQKRYSQIAGIVMIGITNEKNEVLLKGPDAWSPPGGAVKPGEDWAAAARRTIENQTGAAIQVEEPALVEQMHFQKKGDHEATFSAYILHFEASLTDQSKNLSNHPEFAWFRKVPEAAHPNHIKHIKLYLE